MRRSRALGATALFTFALVVGTGVVPAGAQTLPEAPAGLPGLPVIPGVPAPGGPAPTLPTELPGAPGIPGVPAEAAPVQQIVGPAGWAGCNTAATALFVAIFASGLVPGAPVPVPLPVATPTPADVLYGYASPGLALGCGLFGMPASAAACTTDGSLGVVPFVSLKPAGTVVATIAGAEAAAAGQGAPVTGALSGPVGGGLGCGATSGSSLPTTDVAADLTDLPGGVGATPDAASEVLGVGVEDAGDPLGMTAGAIRTGQAAASGLTGSDGGSEQAAALAASTGAKWTPLRITAVAMITALALALMLRWLALSPAPVGGRKRDSF